MPECPRCKLINPSGTRLCDCGYALSLPPDMQAAAIRNPVSGGSSRRAVAILLIAAVGLAWTAYLLMINGSALLGIAPNNLAGVYMIVLIPVSLAVVGLAFILLNARK